MASRFDRMEIHDWDGVHVLDLGQMDIWDGADLSLLREVLARLIENDGHRLIGVNMQHVKYIPSGFFGMLFDWHEKGSAIYLYSPQPNVGNMLWFRQFFEGEGNGRYLLCSEEKVALAADSEPEWNNHDNHAWDEDEDARPVPATIG